MAPTARFSIIALIAAVLGFFAINAYLNYSNLERLSEREDWSRLVEIVEDEDEKKRQRLDALRKLLDHRSPLPSPIQNRLMKFRDSGDKQSHEFETYYEYVSDALTWTNAEQVKATHRELKDTVRQIVEQNIGRIHPTFPDKNKRRFVDIKFVFNSSEGKAPLAQSEHVQMTGPLATPFVGRSSDEIIALRNEIKTVGAVVRFSEAVGEYEGINVDCAGDASVQISDLYLIDLEQRSILAFHRLQGSAPPPEISVTTVDDECSSSGAIPDSRPYLRERML